MTTRLSQASLTFAVSGTVTVDVCTRAHTGGEKATRLTRLTCGSQQDRKRAEFFGAVFIESAASGDEALNAIRRRSPELVLAIHPMTVMNGIELAGLIKARPNPPVVVVIGASEDAGFEVACAAAGADFCLEKRHLQARLLAFLQQRFSRAWAKGVLARRVRGAARAAAL
jgi:CheY-like chemotaxis protein